MQSLIHSVEEDPFLITVTYHRICFSKLNPAPPLKKAKRVHVAQKMFIREVPFGITKADIQNAWVSSGRSGMVLDVEIRQRRADIAIPTRYAFVTFSGAKDNVKKGVTLDIRGELIEISPHRRNKRRKAL